MNIFLDTMIYLHCSPVEHIDFKDLLKTDGIKLLVPRVTFKELDKHKSSHGSSRVRDRARNALIYLEDTIESGGHIRDGLMLEFLPNMPQIDFNHYGLNKSWNDDLLIASALECKLSDTESETILITQDTGARLTCRHLGVRTLKLPDKYCLSPELDENEKEIRKLRNELAILKNALPKINVGILDFPGEAAHFKIREPEIVNEDQVSKKIQQVKEKFPLITPPAENAQPESPSDLLSRYSSSKLLGSIALGNSISDDEYARYNEELVEYYAIYERYLRNSLAVESRLRRTIQFALTVSNIGSAPAEDVDVHFHFPDGFILVPEEKRPRLPSEPSPPNKPRTAFQKMQDQIPNLDHSMLFPSYRIPDLSEASSNFNIRRTNSYDITDHFVRIKHGFVETLPELYLVFDQFDDAKSFHCHYEVSVGNLPGPVKGQLNFVIEKQSLHKK